MSNEETEDTGVRVTDKRRIDPETFEVRQQETAGVPDEGIEAELLEVEIELDEVESKIAELTGDLQRVHARLQFALLRRPRVGPRHDVQVLPCQ